MQASNRLRFGIVYSVEIVIGRIKRRSSRCECHSCDTGYARAGIDCEWSWGIKIRIHSAKAGLITLPDVPNGRASGRTDRRSRKDLYPPRQVESINNACKRWRWRSRVGYGLRRSTSDCERGKNQN